MTALSPWRRLVAVGVACAALSVLVSACGDDSGSSSSATTAASTDETAAPEDVIAPDAEVTAGLNQAIADMHSLADGVASGTATDAQFEEVHEGWEAIEGTIKQNDVDGYLALEDALAAMQTAVTDKDAAAAKTAADNFETAANPYLAKHP